MAPIDASSMDEVMQMQLNNRDWPVLCAEAEWEMVDENQAMALVAFPEENSGPTPISWAARLLGAPKKSQVSAIEGKVQATKEKAVKSQVQVEEQELPDPKELAREARSKHVTTGGGQTLRSNTQCEWKTVVAEEDDDVSHLQMLRKAPVRERGSGKCQVKGKASKAMKSTKSADQDRDGKKVQEHPQSKKQTSRIDIREGLNIMGFA
ncbi:Pentatricopeptide repeat-containing protein [Durusdinium trenchii]|uniref:Chloroplastic n=1 Tax=Durusdinium trenchii TaxID=1381693 RepID=A0ABP0JVH2_9DINO